jgi:diaminohydroxyphosphoribosylaminopyrimidine deaminase / 5-amino-6-(5-phosphoribosylamino)uracil reductase
MDRQMMKRALALAKRAIGRVEPNPMVGCVLVKGRSRIIGQGYHRRFGGAHAEVNAFASATESPRGATAYVTLEPCSHFGKTPPCCNALIEAGVRRVVAAMIDPGEFVAGRGIRKLRAAGIDVSVGCCEAESRRLNRPYLTLCARGRPHVILKWAQTLDGGIAVPTGRDRKISGELAHQWVHRLRARVDGVLVGIDTAIADDPMLNARNTSVRRLATRVVLDSNLRLPKRCRLVQTAPDIPTILFTTPRGLDTRAKHATALERLGVEIVRVRSVADRVDIRSVLKELGKRQYSNLLVEGGARVIQSFLKAKLADEINAFVSPRLVPSQGAIRLTNLNSFAGDRFTVRRVGEDMLYHATRE